jgi:hypothetical protein
MWDDNEERNRTQLHLLRMMELDLKDMSFNDKHLVEEHECLILELKYFLDTYAKYIKDNR